MIYALADTHLDGGQDKPMDIFSSVWKDHKEKIEYNWRNIINDDDCVLIAGDISWALKLEDAIEDLKFLDSLTGKKIISRGNHDYWWSSLKKMNDLGLQNIQFLQNNSYSVEGYEIVGSRLWCDKTSMEFQEGEDRIIDRELIRLDISIKSAKPDRPIIAMVHYPPFDKEKSPNEFHNLMKQNNVEICVYGHLHGEGGKKAVEGLVDGIEYHLTAADYLNFTPKLIRR